MSPGNSAQRRWWWVTCIGLGWSAVFLIFGCNTNQLSNTRPDHSNELEAGWKFSCISGESIEPFDDDDTKAMVLIFIATDCPIANAYHPALQKIYQDFSSRGIVFFLVHSTSEITKAAADSHAREFDLSLPIVLDNQLSIAKRVGAEVTPEVFVLQRGLDKPVYQGAIDDLYAGFGKKRPAPTQHYLRDALAEFLDGSAITVPKTKPIGCFIAFD